MAPCHLQAAARTNPQRHVTAAGLLPLSGHRGHGRACWRPAPVANDPGCSLIVRKYDSEQDAATVRTRLKAKRDRIERERQRNIDLVVNYVISDDDAKHRIAKLKEERLRVDAALAALDAGHPLVTWENYSMAGHAAAGDEGGFLIDYFRAVVHSVIIHPKGPRQCFEVEVKGKLPASPGV